MARTTHDTQPSSSDLVVLTDFEEERAMLRLEPTMKRLHRDVAVRG